MPETPRSGITTDIDLSEPISLKNITKKATQDLERQIILKVLQENSWNRQKTAKWLQISYRSLLYKLSEGGMPEVPPRPIRISHLLKKPDERTLKTPPSPREPASPRRLPDDALLAARIYLRAASTCFK